MSSFCPCSCPQESWGAWSSLVLAGSDQNEATLRGSSLCILGAWIFLRGLNIMLLLKNKYSCTLPGVYLRHLGNKQDAINIQKEIYTTGQKFHESYWTWTKCYFLFLRNEQTMIVMGHNQEAQTSHALPAVSAPLAVRLKLRVVSRTQCASHMARGLIPFGCSKCSLLRKHHPPSWLMYNKSASTSWLCC